MSHQQNGDSDSINQISRRRRSQSYSSRAPSLDLAHPQTRITIEWSNLRYTPKPRKSIWIFDRKREGVKRLPLSGLFGKVCPGQVLGVIGPKGSGKSAFLRLLAGRLDGGDIAGELYVNGAKRGTAWRRVVAFVEQDTGYLDSRLTVRELVKYYADLTVPTRYGEMEKGARIAHVLKCMNIEHLVDSMIGGSRVKGLKEDERKRLAIALELLQEPKLLLLDEPTTGLESKIADDVIKYLQQLAIVDDITIILTIVQPRMSVVSMMTNVLLMSQGSLVFFGPFNEATALFESKNLHCPEFESPIDFMLHTMTPFTAEAREVLDDLIQAETMRHWQPSISSAASMASTLPSLAEYHPVRNLSRWAELKVVIARYFRMTTRDKELFWTNISLITIATLLAMATYFQLPIDDYGAVRNRLGFFNFVVFDGVLIAAMTALISEHEYAIKRERYRSIARASSYYWAFFIVQIPLWIIYLLIATIAEYYVCGLRYSPFTALLVFLGFYLLITIQALALGIMFAACVNSISMAVALGAFYVVMVHLYNGTTANTDNMTWVLRWIRYVCPLYYSMSGMAQNEFDGQIIDMKPGAYWMRRYGIDNVSVMWCAGALMIITAFTIALSLYVFVRRSRPVMALE